MSIRRSVFFFCSVFGCCRRREQSARRPRLESQARCLCHINISDSALKVVLSYYPVCRCQRTNRFRTFQATKKLNFAPTINFVSENHGRDKIESNLQSQNVQEPTPDQRSPAFGG